MTQGKQLSLDLTRGSIVPMIIRFSIPLVLGNLFQQLYHIVDGSVVGRFCGVEALDYLICTHEHWDHAGGMRGVAFSALLGLCDFRKDALATALHASILQRKYPEAEISLSCPRLRPIANHPDVRPGEIGERELCQVLCAYRIFLPFAGITVSSRESASFRNGMAKIAATKVSAGVSTGIGDHASKYGGSEEKSGREGDEQFEISDARSLSKMYSDLSGEGLQPVLNDYVYV